MLPEYAVIYSYYRLLVFFISQVVFYAQQR